jgi:hypothetical protein
MRQIIREAMLREGVDHSDDKLLDTLAKECAKCTICDYGAKRCQKCYFNTALYNGDDVARAMLMRTAWVIKHAETKAWFDRCDQQRLERAAREAEEAKIDQEVERTGIIGVAAIIGILIVGLIIFSNYRDAKAKALRAEYAAREASTQAASKPAANNTSSKVREIERAIQRMNVYDINYDGLVNCQDYVAAFKRAYPDAQIIYNPAIGPTGHVFNRVLSDDGWIYVEPQGQKDGVWPMKSVWAEWESVRHLNQEVTNEYAK